MQSTVLSVSACIEEAQKAGLLVEWLFVRDYPCPSTIEYTNRFCSRLGKIIDVRYKDLGRARNAGTEAARGRYLAFIDADDLWTSNWLVAAHRFAESLSNDRFILHPELAIFFEGRLDKLRLRDCEQEPTHNRQLLTKNCWTVSTFGLRQLYLAQPYLPINIDAGFGYEDWHWNCETTAAGILHKIVPNTLHCFRVKVWKESLYQTTLDKSCIIWPSRLFALAYQMTEKK